MSDPPKRSAQTTAGRLADALEYLEASRQNVRDLRDQLKQADARIADLEAMIPPKPPNGDKLGWFHRPTVRPEFGLEADNV